MLIPWIVHKHIITAWCCFIGTLNKKSQISWHDRWKIHNEWRVRYTSDDVLRVKRKRHFYLTDDRTMIFCDITTKDKPSFFRLRCICLLANQGDFPPSFCYPLRFVSQVMAGWSAADSPPDFFDLLCRKRDYAECR